ARRISFPEPEPSARPRIPRLATRSHRRGAIMDYYSPLSRLGLRFGLRGDEGSKRGRSRGLVSSLPIGLAVALRSRSTGCATLGLERLRHRHALDLVDSLSSAARTTLARLGPVRGRFSR